MRLKSLFLAALCAAAVWCLTACGSGAPSPGTDADSPGNADAAAEPSSAEIQDGVYTEQVVSMKGTSAITVTIQDGKLSAIDVDSPDSFQIMRAAKEMVIPAILENQSYNVDSVTGATFSSSAIKQGVKKTVEEAGASAGQFDADCTSGEAVPAETETADVVVVGSGAAGLSAAIQLKRNGVENVVLLEKLGYYGGTSGNSSGGAWVVGGSEFNRNTGYDMTEEEFIAHFYNACGAEPGSLNEELLKNIYAVSAETFTWYYEEAGVPWDLTQYTFGDSLEEMPVAWVEKFYETPWENGCGYTLVDALVSKAEELGVDLRLNSRAAALLTEDGAVKGVHVEGKETVYDLTAEKVVLATGGFQRNKDLLAEIAPKFTNAVPFTGAGSTGDGIVMAEELGAYVLGNGIGGARGLDDRFGYQGQLGMQVWAVGPVVNLEGKRFHNEAEHYSYCMEDIVTQPDGIAFGITDGASADAAVMGELLSLRYAYQADTLEELAGEIGVTPAAFASEIAGYNEIKESGADDPAFGTPNGAMTAVTQAPYYAVKIRGVSSFSLAGLAVDGQCRILREDGSAIENLYGAGELICGNYLQNRYAGSGSQVGGGLYEGRIIADAISAELGA